MALTESERSLLCDAFEDAPFEFWARDLDGVCIVANAQTRRLGEILGRKVTDANVPPEVIESWLANNRRAYAGEVVQNEFEYGIGERRRYLKCYIVPLRITGEIRGILGFNIDVTEQKRIEAALREVDRRRGEFLGVLSHELRNPLAVIASSLRTLDRAQLADEQLQRAVAAIDRQSRQLSRLVDDLLDITRISSGKIGLRRATLDLVQLVRTTVEDHRELLADRDVALRLPDAPVWTHGDATRLAQVLGNLLNNAAKFTAAGDAIVVSLEVRSGLATLAVSDSGIGIAEPWLERVFEPFVQADCSSRGLGLGLALVKTLVDMHDGDVRAHSAGPDCGACFTIALPVTTSERREPSPPPRVSTPRKVLVIEDNQDVAEWLATALALSGHDVTVSPDGEAGLAKARELGPEVILCDIGLPGALDGYAVARRLCEDAALATAYRVALSGYAQPADQKRARDAGFEAHISKPPDLDVLERLLAELPKRA
jgi:two-component system CheB/CheR fusion protein